MLNHYLLFSVPCCFLLDCLIKEATCNVMVDHLQSRVTPWRQYSSHVKVRGTLSKMDVPGLAWPFLLRENHQQSTKAIVDHHALTITFRHPQLNTTINSQSGNPAQAFPSLIPNQNSQTAAPVTCLLTGLPTPTQLYRRIPLRKGLNFVTVCLLLTTALVGSNLFHSSLYLQGNQLTEDLQVLSGMRGVESASCWDRSRTV